MAENEIFFGVFLTRCVSRTYYNQILVLALEYKKIFIDELTGQLYKEILDQLIVDFQSAVEKLFNSQVFIRNYVKGIRG